MELKECPHCGGPAMLRSNYSRRLNTHYVSCKCTICGASGKAFPDDEAPRDNGWKSQACTDAINAWNMRFNG